MSNIFLDVTRFHAKFNLPLPSEPTLLDTELQGLRIAQLYEEVDEYVDAVSAGDLEEVFDALVDLVYFAVGTAVCHGLPFDEGFDRVHEANMKKVRSQSPNASAERGSKYDVVKPEGWQPPILKDLV